MMLAGRSYEICRVSHQMSTYILPAADFEVRCSVLGVSLFEERASLITCRDDEGVYEGEL